MKARLSSSPGRRCKCNVKAPRKFAKLVTLVKVPDVSPGGSLVSVSELQNGGLSSRTTANLQSDRQPLGREPAGDRDSCGSGQCAFYEHPARHVLCSHN